MSFALILPTLNPGPTWPLWLASLRMQTCQPDIVLIVDSTSCDGQIDPTVLPGFQVHKIPRHTFNHGATRQWAFDKVSSRVDFVVYMTQDAILADENALGRLIASFADTSVGAAYGRQVPHPHAGHFAAHARLFNYKPESHMTLLSDRDRLGIKTAFLSNSFAAYRVADLMAVGGFPVTDYGEDSHVAARLLTNHRAIAYVAEARVYHSHENTLMEEFHRYSKAGYFHARHPGLLEIFGKPFTEGRRFVISESRYLLKHAPYLLPMAILRNLLKLMGYRYGHSKGRSGL